MRVLQVTHQFLPEYVGGVEVHVAQLSRSLRDAGHQVALFTGGNHAEQRTWEGMELTTVAGGVRSPRGRAATFMATFRNRAADDAFAELLERLRPDVVHFHHLLGLSLRLVELARARGIPTCYTLHDYWFICPTTQLLDHRGELCDGPVAGLNCARCATARMPGIAWTAATPALAPVFALRQRRVRRALAGIDRLLAPSRFLAEIAVRAGLPSARVEMVDFGVHRGHTGAPAVSTPRGGPLQVTYLGAIAPSKGVHVLIEACRLLPPGTLEVDVCGDLSAYPGYAQRLQASAQGLPIHFSGLVAREDVPDVLARSDVVVAPSIWYENAPLVLNEAYAAGVPVVASRLGALAEKVEDGVTGLLFPRGDAAALAGVLERLTHEEHLLERLRSGISPVRTWEEHVAHMERVYNALVKTVAGL